MTNIGIFLKLLTILLTTLLTTSVSLSFFIHISKYGKTSL